MILLALVLVHCSAQEFRPTNQNEMLRNIIKTDQHLLIGSSSSLYRISPDSLEVDGSITLTSENRLLVADNGGTFDDYVLSCDNNRCFLAEITDFSDIAWQLEPSDSLIRSGAINLRGVFVPSLDGTSELIYAESANGEDGRRVVRGELTNVDFAMTPQNSEFSLLTV